MQLLPNNLIINSRPYKSTVINDKMYIPNDIDIHNLWLIQSLTALTTNYVINLNFLIGILLSDTRPNDIKSV